MKTHVNLMSPAMQRQVFIRRWLRRWLIVGAGWSAIVAVVVGAQTLRAQAQQTLRDQLEFAYTPIRTTKTQLVELKKRADALRTEERLSLSLQQDVSAVHLLGAVSRSCAATNQSVFVEQFTARIVPPGSGAKLHGSIALAGIGRSSEAVTQFVTQLQETGAFAEVKLASSNVTDVLTQSVQRFRIECQHE